MSDILMTTLAAIVLLGTLVFAHELGHFTMAKIMGIRVEEFAFGFGPKWIRLFKRGDTEYTIHPIPLGGFVKLAGAEPGEVGLPNGFQSKPWLTRFAVYFAGPFMSFVFGYLVFCTLGMTVGLPISRDVQNRVDLVMPNTEADRVGMRTGDEIISINGKATKTGEAMLAAVHENPNKRMKIVIRRSGRLVTVYATPKPTKMGGKVVGLLGFAPRQRLERVGLAESFEYGNQVTMAFAATLIKVLPSRAAKDAVGGPISIVDATYNSLKRGPNGYLELMGILSLSFAFVNMLPIFVVDGGQMLLLVIEGLKRRRLSAKTWEITQKIGLTQIAIIFILIMYLDLSRLADNKLFR